MIEDLKNKATTLLDFFALVFRPYLKYKYETPKRKGWEAKLLGFLIWLSTWVVCSIIYCFFIYVFFLKEEQVKISDQIQNFLNFAELPTIFKTVFYNSYLSLEMNIFLLIILYYAIVGYAETKFLKSFKIHFDLSGIIKVIKLGTFDRNSKIAEQHPDQTVNAKKNIHSALSEESVETISILTPSGWDMFGLPKEDQRPPSGNISFFKKIWRQLRKHTNNSINDGYLLTSISNSSIQTRIILLDPNGEAYKERETDYLRPEAHHPIEKLGDYRKGIEISIQNIKRAYALNPNIKLKVIDTVPEWKLIISRGEAWVQPVIPKLRSDHCPLYGFKKTEHSMYHAYFNLFEKIWHSDKAKEVSLLGEPPL